MISLPGYLLAFSFLSAMLYFFSIVPLRRVRRAKLWRETPCVILSSSVEEDATESGVYRVLVTYKFEAAGRAYVASRYSFAVGATAGYRGKRAVVARLAPGTRAVCYVNPANPGDAVLERGVTWDMVFVGVLLVVMLCVFFFFAWHEVRGQPASSAMSSHCRYWPTECCLASSWSAYDEILRPGGLIAMVAVTVFNWPSVARMLRS